MIVKLRRGFGNWVVFGGHGVILVLALQAEDFDTVLAALALIMCAGSSCPINLNPGGGTTGSCAIERPPALATSAANANA